MIKKNPFIGTSVMPDFKIENYPPDDVASWWLDREDYVLHGPGLSSEVRANVIQWLHCEGGYDFMKLVKANWSGCDDFHDFTEIFRKCFQNHYADKSPDEIDNWINEEDVTWWKSLPELLTVYRGCESNRWQGLSWTISRSVAKGFARGHRYRRLNDPVIAAATVNKKDIFFATNDREEEEIVWDATQAKVEIKPAYL